jgi:hypothetical protein
VAISDRRSCPRLGTRGTFACVASEDVGGLLRQEPLLVAPWLCGHRCLCCLQQDNRIIHPAQHVARVRRAHAPQDIAAVRLIDHFEQHLRELLSSDGRGHPDDYDLPSRQVKDGGDRARKPAFAYVCGWRHGDAALSNQLTEVVSEHTNLTVVTPYTLASDLPSLSEAQLGRLPHPHTRRTPKGEGRGRGVAFWRKRDRRLSEHGIRTR